MNILKGNKIYVLILLVNLMFTFSIIAQSYLMVDYDNIPLLAIFAISVMGYFLFDFVLKKSLHKILFIMAVITIGLAYIYYFGLKTDLYMQVSNNIAIINDAVKSASVTYYEQYKFFFMCAIPLLVFIFLMFASKGLTNLVLIYSLVVMILFWYLGFNEIVIKNLSIFTFIEIASYGVNNCIGSLRKLKKINPNIKVNSGTLCLFFILPALAISFVTTKLPQEYKGNYIEIINAKLKSNFAPSKGNLSKSTYDLKTAGYSSSLKKLGGPINLNDELVFSVKSDKTEYLRGSIKDNYNGFAWSKKKEDYSLKIRDGYSVLSSNTVLTSVLKNKKTLSIYAEKNNISSIFSPIYTYNVKLDKGDVYYDDIPTFAADLSKVKNYSVDYYDMLEAQAFENCFDLEWLKEGINEGYSSVFKQKYENYLQVPTSITQRTKDLLANIAPNGENRYYTITKIKEYLDKNYPYSTIVSDVPQNQDFIDNFLFTEKKGYCVYFATAATILCRMEGIPARYVEGYKMPEDKDSDGLYKVTNKEAHAWCEVLVDPDKDLWTTLEVTPSAVTQAFTSLVPVAVVPESKAKVDSDTEVPEVSKNKSKTGNNISLERFKFSKINIVIGLLFSSIVLIAAKILTVLAKIKKILKAKSSVPFYKYYVSRLKQIGIVKPDFLGDLEYIETLDDIELKAMLEKIVFISYEEFYGKRFLDNSSRIDSYKKLESYIKRNDNKTSYILKKYFVF